MGLSSNVKSGRHSAAKIQKGFFKYVFVSRNTWILGRLKHIETTLIVLPKTIIEAIKGSFKEHKKFFQKYSLIGRLKIYLMLLR